MRFTDELIDELADALFAWEDLNSTLADENLIPEGWTL